MRPTKTTNPIHFTDLEHRRFEDFCLALLYPHTTWADIAHYGRSGGDKGVDIFGVETLEGGTSRTWYIQCRRYQNATAGTLRKAVDDSVKRADTLPEVLLVVTACNVSRTATESYKQYAISKGVRTPMLWTASILEAKLYAERHDLLFSYFGISEATHQRKRERTITRNLGMKRRLRSVLLAPPVEGGGIRRLGKFNTSRIIMHSVDDDSYPHDNVTRDGISGWMKMEIWDFYHNGLEVVFDVERGVQTKEGKWAPVEGQIEFDREKFDEINLMRIAQIPFRNIVEVDELGDEYYQRPHIYCRYADAGRPYEGFRWFRIDGDDEYAELEPEDRLPVTAVVRSSA